MNAIDTAFENLKTGNKKDEVKEEEDVNLSFAQ